MRISIIGPAYPLRGGIAHHVYWLRQALTARGHTVQVVSFRKLYPGLFFPGTTELDSSRLKLDPGALPVLTPLNPTTWLRALNLVKSVSPDVVVFEWWQPYFAPVVGTLARWFRKARLQCVIECHNVLPHEQNPLDRWLLRYAFSSIDRFITHSANDRADLLELLPGKNVSVSPLPELAEFSNRGNAQRNGRTILFFGKVRKYKGLDVLLSAMPKVLSKIDCNLLVIGEFYEPVERYRQRIRELGVESHVEICNRYVPNEEVSEIFQRADVLVLPYTSASQSGVARIALSNGLPVIASRTGGLSEAIIEGVNGMLFPPGDTASLADRIVTYFSNNLGPAFSERVSKPSGAASRTVLAEMIERLCR